MAFSLFEPDGKLSSIVPSLGAGVEPGNPTVLPLEVLQQFHFTFLIRHPRRSIPSFYRCTTPPLSQGTGFDGFLPSEAGYLELRRMLDFCIEKGLVDKSRLIVIDADDLLDEPEKIVRSYCDRVAIDFRPEMLEWSDADREHAARLVPTVFQGFHGNVDGSSSLKPRTHAQKTVSVEDENKEWAEKYGSEAQRVIRETVDANIPHYEYLKQYCLKV
ncbi:hypothetical protein JDV02_000166 [Purpureocillium takamizusanense]|nr:uncharacterized protein JDV02_000166 [Purpureocillium takamizusanense]UNI13418.1 hypothetical protein JDV02_000166 [Purpureocillium takamizusanense]